MRKCIKIKRLRGKGRRSKDWVSDRAVITVVLLAVTMVLLLVGFSGPSVYLRLPGLAGWIYIAIVIVAAAVAFVVLFRIGEKRKKGNPSGLRAENRRSKRIQLQ